MFDGYVRDNAFWKPRAPAVITPARTVSYAQLDGDIDRIAAALPDFGIRPDAGIVSVRVNDAYLDRVVILALARLGVASSPAADHDADRYIVYDPLQTWTPGAREIRLDRDWFVDALAASVAPAPLAYMEPDTLARVLLSSGTTRVPRRIGFSWQRLQMSLLGQIRTFAAGKQGLWVPLTEIDSSLGFAVTVAAWAMGAASGSGFVPEALPGLMERYPEGVVGMTPIQLSAVLSALPDGFQPKPDWRLQVGGSSLPRKLGEEAVMRLSPDVRMGYGATELVRIAAGPAARLWDTPGAVGVAVAGAHIQFVDEDDQQVPEGQSGELRIKSMRSADGYIGDPDSTAQRFRDGWYYTSDIGKRLADGRIVLEGRVDDRMIVEGAKFMPRILEDAALACPGVVDCATFAIPDESGLERCWLAVVTEPGFDRDGLAPHLANYPNLPPNRFAWTDEIPRNARGKIERNKLRDALIAALEAQGGAA